MAKHFKDFNKETKDLLTKNYPAPGSWKFESKMKPADREWLLNPQSDFNDKTKSVSIDVEYNIKERNLKTKTNVAADGTIKPQVTYEASGHKVEAKLDGLTVDAPYEVTYEGAVQQALVYDKLTRKAAEVAFAYPVGPAVVGASIVYGIQKGTVNWNAGLRVTEKGYIVNVVTADLKKFVTGVYAPLKIGKCSIKLAAQFDCGGGAFKATVGGEAPFTCPLTGCNLTLRAKATQDLEISFSIINKFAEKWTGVFSFTAKDCFKAGVHLTRE